MKLIDQHSILASLENALHPASTLVDARTERDWLSFLCDFASVINFYDNTNTNRGNWMPFLLKDPVLLLASVSKTRFADYHTPYINACVKLGRISSENSDAADTAWSFNLVFDQLTDVFMCIKRWVYYMQKSPDEYDLKKYVLSQVKTNYSGYFWAVVSLRQNLFLSSTIQGIQPVNTTRFYFFDQNDEKIWKENKNKNPYWEVLGLKQPLKENSTADIFNALQKAGDELFNFFNAIIRHAGPEYEKQKVKKSKYPDTTLLRTFVHLLKNHQQQLNEVSTRHLGFYYKDILKQATLPPVADKVFLYAELSNKNGAFQLPAGTAFDAGVDADKQQVLFTTLEDVSLNPAAITGAYTLTKSTGKDSLSSLYLQTMANPAGLQLDAAGNVQAWDTFGKAGTDNTPLTSGIAFASPLLLLREGERKISLSLYFDGAIDIRLLQQARYFLSTQLNWVEVKAVVKDAIEDGPVSLEIELSISQPAIESFLVDPDALNSAWPVLKIAFTRIPDISVPPQLTRIDLSVNVAAIKTFQLYNDFGAISPKAAYQLFGPTPALKSSFIIGNNEIFSKPFDTLVIGWEWDKLPESFLKYYQQYNNYLAYQESLKPGKKPSIFRRIWNWIKNIFRRNRVPVNAIPFNNICFTVDFNLLQENYWKKIDMGNVKNSVDATNCIPCNDPDGCPPVVVNASDLLFTIVEPDCTLHNTSFFSYAAVQQPQAANPAIQQTPLKYTDTSSSGFIKMELTGPVYGFGAELYASVVNYTALQNAKAIAIRRRKPQFIQPPNLPFAPKVKGLTASYTASQTYMFTGTPEGYPIQCFLYSPLANYQMYDNSQPVVNYNYTFENKLQMGMQKQGIPFYHSFDHDGCLFLQLENVIAPNELNLYFELSGRSGGSPVNNEQRLNKQVDEFYLSNEGWKPLPILSDGTNNMTCSGILKVNVPGDIATQSSVMPAGKYWLAIAAKGQAASFSKTILARTNGFMAQRSSAISVTAIEAPRLNADSIAKPQFAIPQVALIAQPFPSFGGKGLEDESMMYRRVSNRLKTKDRIISAADYAGLIQQEFSDIYYSKTIFNLYKKSTEVYVLKSYESWTSPGAFLPSVSECSEKKILALLSERTSAFSNISVSNFDYQYVRITASLSLKQGFEWLGVERKVNHALNIFLSPWIVNIGQQVMIGQSINDAQVAAFIKTIEGVAEVGSVLFQTIDANAPTGQIENASYEHTIIPLTDTVLLVSYMNHVLNAIQQ